MLKCSYCYRMKDNFDFYKNRSTTNKFTYNCKECIRFQNNSLYKSRYTCMFCDYRTHLRFNQNKHIKTEKHMKQLCKYLFFSPSINKLIFNLL